MSTALEANYQCNPYPMVQAKRSAAVGPVSCIFNVTWLAGDVKEPTHLSERVGDEIPGVVVYLSLHAWVGWVSEVKMD